MIDDRRLLAAGSASVFAGKTRRKYRLQPAGFKPVQKETSRCRHRRSPSFCIFDEASFMPYSGQETAKPDGINFLSGFFAAFHPKLRQLKKTAIKTSRKTEIFGSKKEKVQSRRAQNVHAAHFAHCTPALFKKGRLQCLPHGSPISQKKKTAAKRPQSKNRLHKNEASR